MYTSGGEVILGHFLCLDVENMGLDDISWRRLHFLETWLKYGSEADYYLKDPFLPRFAAQVRWCAVTGTGHTLGSGALVRCNWEETHTREGPT